MSEYTPLEQWLYDSGVAMPGDVRRIARKIETSDWLAAHDAEVRAESQQVLAWIERTLALPMYQDEIGDYDEGVLMALKGVRKMLNGTSRPDASWRTADLRAEPSDAQVEIAWRAWMGLASDEVVAGNWIGQARRDARRALRAAFKLGGA